MFKLIVLTVLLGLAVARPFDEAKSYVNDVNADGTFNFSYETVDGVHVAASGDANHVSGSYKYIGPDNIPISLTYIADENGFQPQGSHLPIGPDVPAYILRSIEYIRTHPSKV